VKEGEIRMTVIAGVDGCPFGWLCITKNLNDGIIKSQIFSSATELFDQNPQPQIFAIDIPIGIPDAGSRQCDVLARKMLGPKRGTSVFPAPIRPALKCDTRIKADAVTRSVDGRGVSPFSWSLYPKINAVDHVLVSDHELREKVFEIHPELSFMALNNSIPILEPKRKSKGESIRRVLVNNSFGPNIFDLVRQQFSANHVSNDDINDAFAALWTSERNFNGKANVVPDVIEIDSVGLRMGIWY
jgi:predicted RNase H-like nuclease